NRLGDILKFESGDVKRYSREDVTVLSGQELSMGAVVGKVALGSCPVTGTADAGNSGAGTCSAVSAGAQAQVGIYKVQCVKVVSGAGDFEVIAPDGKLVGIATTGIAFTSPHINLTVNDGTPDFALGDKFTIAIPAGSGKVKAIDFSAVDGSQNAYGILIGAVDTTGTLKSLAFTSGGTYAVMPGDQVKGATSGATGRVQSLSLSSGSWANGDAAGTLILDDVAGTFQSENLNVEDNTNVATIGGNASAYYPDRPGVAVVRDAEINAANLVWPAGATSDQKAAALVRLAERGIVSRPIA
ncbi:MAG: head decoration protein, partial [Desulfobacteraceae bacterium]|nr:head decoration protein [Desulfobacteraceae bacterium]